jgi:hypothetical protein
MIADDFSLTQQSAFNLPRTCRASRAMSEIFDLINCLGKEKKSQLSCKVDLIISQGGWL